MTMYGPDDGMAGPDDATAFGMFFKILILY
jgi:hypothetical protein